MFCQKSFLKIGERISQFQILPKGARERVLSLMEGGIYCGKKAAPSDGCPDIGAIRREALENRNNFFDKFFSLVLGVFFLVSMLFVGREAARYAVSRSVAEGGNPFCVVLDAGHGGDDPGKIGINGVEEKQLNLEITMLVKQFLEANGVQVVMTREDDKGMYDRTAPNKKVQDMKNRIALIEETKPKITVSIHQNSYPEEYVHGAQVFYYSGSKEGEALAKLLQEQLIQRADPENQRRVKANASYYLLKKAEGPIVIVECGFLSNRAEAEKLCRPEYQQRIAWAIHMGIMQYLNEAGL